MNDISSKSVGVVEAFQMTKKRRWNNSEWPEWLNDAWNKSPGENAVWPNPDALRNPEHNSADELVCGTLDGVQVITFGDYIVRDVSGDLYVVTE